MSAPDRLQTHATEFRTSIALAVAGKLLDAGSTLFVLAVTTDTREGVRLSRMLMREIGVAPAVLFITLAGVSGTLAAGMALDASVGLYAEDARRRLTVRSVYLSVAAVTTAVGIHNLSLLW